MTTTESSSTENTDTNGHAKKKSGHKERPGAAREYYMVDPDKLVVIGVDTEDGPEHPLYDERIKLPLDDLMVKNIQVYGVLKPIFAQKDGERILVTDGRRRVLHAREAAKLQKAAGEEQVKVPVLFRKGDEKMIFGISRAANAMAAVDGPLTNSRNAQRMLDMGMEVEEIAISFGVKPQAIKDWISLLDLSATVRKAVERGEVSVSAGATMAKLPKEEQEAHLEELRKEGLKPTVDRVINKARQKRGKGEHLSSHERIKKAREVLVKLGADNATKDELVAGIEKISKALFGKGWEKLVAEAAEKTAK